MHLLLAAALGAIAPDAAADRRNMDRQIAHELERRLQLDPAVDANQIDVEVDRGQVTLKGAVDHGVAEARALLLAQSLAHVHRVKDQLRIRQLDRSDALLKTDAIIALADDAATEAFDVDISVKRGVATVRGVVQSLAERELTQHVVGTVDGIRDVINELKVVPRANRPDAELQAEIQSLLELRQIPVNVTVKNGEAALQGVVRSLPEKQMACQIARPFGISAVDARQVKIDESGEAMRPDSPRSDEAIARDVEGRLRLNPRIYPFQPQATVEDGVVTLTGRVDHLKAQRQATEEALAVKGVARVFNFIKVRPDPADGPDVAGRAAKALERHPLVDASTMNVTSRGGIVFLRGTADSSYEKSVAEDAVAKLRGVARVRNLLVVKHPHEPAYHPAYSWYPYYDVSKYYNRDNTFSAKTDLEIAQDIRRELDWSPFVHDDIKVTVEDGVATLVGAVEDWSAYRAAIVNAKEGGATRVRADLQVVSREGE